MPPKPTRIWRPPPPSPPNQCDVGSTGHVLLADDELGPLIRADGVHRSSEMLQEPGKAWLLRDMKPWPTSPIVSGGFEREERVMVKPTGSVSRCLATSIWRVSASCRQSADG